MKESSKGEQRVLIIEQGLELCIATMQHISSTIYMAMSHRDSTNTLIDTLWKESNRHTYTHTHTHTYTHILTHERQLFPEHVSRKTIV